MDASGVRIVIPHRGLRAGKVRLATELTQSDRVRLSRTMLQQVSRAARAVASDLVLISPDESMALTAKAVRVRFMLQVGGIGMNHALGQARDRAVDDGVRTLVVISADLPEVTSGDLNFLLREVPDEPGPSVTIAPDVAGCGTNALVLRPPDAIPFMFGIGSRTAHTREASRRSIRIAIVERPGLARDIDLPADLAAWRPDTLARGLYPDGLDPFGA